MLVCLLLLPADRDLLSRGISSVSGGREELMNDDVVCGVPGVQQVAVRCGVRADSAGAGLGTAARGALRLQRETVRGLGRGVQAENI